MTQPATTGQWSSGCCGCCDDTNICCEGMCCYFCAMGSLSSRLEDKLGGQCRVGCSVCCLSLCTQGCAALLFSVNLRKRVAARYQIEYGVIDCLQAFCCSHFSICQLQREMMIRGEATSGVWNSAPALLAMGQVVQTVQPNGTIVSTPAPNTAVPEWHSGVCDFMDEPGIFCDNWCFLPCTMSATQSRLDGKSGGYCGTMCCLSIVTSFLGPVVYACYSTLLSKKVAERYNIEWGALDCLAAFFICWCSMCQVQREMTARDEPPGGCWVAADAIPKKLAQPVMLMQPPPMAEMQQVQPLQPQYGQQQQQQPQQHQQQQQPQHGSQQGEQPNQAPADQADGEYPKKTV
jgi:Cys-rich protein (TIGR01571 family)